MQRGEGAIRCDFIDRAVSRGAAKPGDSIEGAIRLNHWSVRNAFRVRPGEAVKGCQHARRSDLVKRAIVVDSAAGSGSIEFSAGAQEQTRERRAAIGAIILAKVIRHSQFAGGSDFENHPAGGERIVRACLAAALGSSVEVAVEALNEGPNQVATAARRRD